MEAAEQGPQMSGHTLDFEVKDGDGSTPDTSSDAIRSRDTSAKLAVRLPSSCLASN